MTYLQDVGALARKDLLLELRAKDTLPAMLLFVVATFVVFHFALPRALLAAGGERAALGGHRLHRAARPRPGLRSGARAARARRARACALRPECHLAGKVACDARLPRRGRGRRAARVRALLPWAERRHGRRRRARGSRHLRRRHLPRRHGGRHPRPRPAPAAHLPAAGHPDRDRRRRRERRRLAGPLPGLPGALRRALRGARAGPPSSTS